MLSFCQYESHKSGSFCFLLAESKICWASQNGNGWVWLSTCGSDGSLCEEFCVFHFEMSRGCSLTFLHNNSNNMRSVRWWRVGGRTPLLSGSLCRRRPWSLFQPLNELLWKVSVWETGPELKGISDKVTRRTSFVVTSVSALPFVLP